MITRSQLLLLVALCSLPCQALWADAAANMRAAAAAQSSASAILPVVEGRGSLTVAGDDYYHRERYEEGASPALSVVDSEGRVLPDGLYRYEFVALPEASQTGSSAQGQSYFGQLQRKDKPQIQRGQFEVKAGEMIFR